MKRVLSFVTTGLFMTGLALLPMSVRADPVTAGGKDVKAQTGAAAMTPATPPATSGVHDSATAVKKPGDKTVTTDPAAKTATPSGSPAVTGGAAAKTPSKNPS